MHIKTKRLLGAGIALAIAATGVLGFNSLAAQAAPGDVGTVDWAAANQNDIWQWAVTGDDADNYAQWIDSMSTLTAGVGCIAPDEPLVIEGLDQHPDAAADPETRPVISLTAALSKADYETGGEFFEIDLSDNACLDEWDLTGQWFLPDAGSIRMVDDSYETVVTDDVITGTGPLVTPSGWLDAPSGQTGDWRTGWVYFERTDGTYIWAVITVQADATSIIPTPANLVVNLGETITIDLADLHNAWFPCEMSDGSPCNPDGVTFGSMPAGVTGDVGGPVQWTPTVGGDFEFTYALTDSVSGAFSEFVTGIIMVIDDADFQPPVLLSRTWNLVVGNTLELDNADFLEGCTSALLGPCATSGLGGYQVVLKSLPVGATANAAIDEVVLSTEVTFVATEVGTFEITYYATEKSAGTSAIITSYIVVTAPRKPIVTG